MWKHVIVCKPIDHISLRTTKLISSGLPCQWRSGSKTMYSNDTKIMSRYNRYQQEKLALHTLQL